MEGNAQTHLQLDSFRVELQKKGAPEWNTFFVSHKVLLF